MSSRYAIPNVPKIISPSSTPPPSEVADISQDTYVPPTTRSAAKQRLKDAEVVLEARNISDTGSESSLEHRARARSRSPILASSEADSNPRRRPSGLSVTRAGSSSKINQDLQSQDDSAPPSSHVNGNLSPYSSSTFQKGWREFSRSPSPLGLIPLHRHHRVLIHKHEIPRKALHVCVGFLTLSFYTHGVQTTAITPWLLGTFAPIAAADWLRHRSEPFNRTYVKCLGALMREREVDGYNGVVWYLMGAYIALRFFPKDVGVMSVLLLSWCDTAASTFGRLCGPYTIRLRRGKSLAGTLAAFVTGLSTAIMFWGWLAPRTGSFPDDPSEGFFFTGELTLPTKLLAFLGFDSGSWRISGSAALGVTGVWTGVVAAFSEFVDVLGWDDNLTIPVLSGLGLWGFLRAFRA